MQHVGVWPTDPLLAFANHGVPEHCTRMCNGGEPPKQCLLQEKTTSRDLVCWALALHTFFCVVLIDGPAQCG